MIRFRVLGAACAALLMFSAAVYADPMPATFNFNSLAAFSPMPASITSNGITATLTADGPFVALPAFFYDVPFAGLALGDQDIAPHTLTIQFSEMRGGLTLDFALDTAGGSQMMLNVQALRGGITVYTGSAVGTFPLGPFPFPQGTVSIANVNFDSIRLSSSQANFAIDNVATAVAPEPPGVTLLAVGLVSAFFLRRRVLQTAGGNAA